MYYMCRANFIRGLREFPLHVPMQIMLATSASVYHKMLSTMFAALFFACPDEPGNLVFDTTSPMSDIWTIAFINCMDMRHNYLLIL